MATIQELEAQLKEAKMYEQQERMRKKKEKEIARRKENNLDVGWSDDYYSLCVGDISFYYWYEKTMCPNADCEACKEWDDCDDKERCFVAQIDGKEVMRLPSSKISYQHEHIENMLLLWIGHYIKANYSLFCPDTLPPQSQ